jgi:hypothetical protein
MSLDAASYAALWDIYTASNNTLRPEYVLPVLHHESGFSPAADNGVGYYGINQINANDLARLTGGHTADGGKTWTGGVDPQVYKTWSASHQLRVIVKPWFLGLIRGFTTPDDPITSGTRLYQANYLPNTLKHAHNYDDVLARHGSAFYSGNPSLDHNKDGKITVGDLAEVIRDESESADVIAAIAKAYLVAPAGVQGPLRLGTGIAGAMPFPKDPVTGDDFTSNGDYIPMDQRNQSAVVGGSKGWLIFIGTLGVVGAAGAGLYWLAAHKSHGRNSLPHLFDNPTNPNAGRVQSLLFRRDSGWTERKATLWARQHGYKAAKVDITEAHIRLRQSPPGRYSRLRTQQFGRGVSAIIGYA